MNFSAIENHPRNLPLGAAVQPSSAPRSRQTPSLAGTAQRPARFRRGAAKSKFLAERAPRWLAFIAICAALPGGCLAQTRKGPNARPVDAIHHVLILSVDGLRPDLLLRAETPRMRALLKSASFTFWAQTAKEAYTLPCHVSMLTGVSSKKHTVTWNDYIEDAYPMSPTLFEVAKKAGYSTAMATGKMKFITLTKPGTIDWHWLPPDEPVEDIEVARQAAELMRAHRPDVLFVHLPGVDTIGHEKEWGSPEQLRAVEQADEAIGVVLDSLDGLQLTSSTLVILTADHGGAGTDHVEGQPASMYIPWAAAGPGVRKDFDLTRVEGLAIKVEDTFATACAFLGIAMDKSVEGRPVLAILSESGK